MNYFLYPLRYLKLVDEHGRALYRRDALLLIALTLILSLPFIATDANFFSQSGFLERVGSFSSVLTGFYVAALVAVATFAVQSADLDKEITVGRITYPESKYEDSFNLTRREYVCAIFGYLAFASLLISILSILFVVIANPALKLLRKVSTYMNLPQQIYETFIPGVLVIILCAVISHMIVTTGHGLYYLIDRMYARTPKTLPKRSKNASET